MNVGKPKKKWNIKRMSADLSDEEIIGFLYEGEDFYLFSPRVPDENGRRETITNPDPNEVKEFIRINYGTARRFTIGASETVF